MSNNGATSTWRTHSCDQDDIDKPVEGLLLRLSIVPATMIGKLSQKFDWGLRTELLLSWHIHIIDKDDESLSVGWTVYTHATLFAFIIDEILSLVGRRLSRE